MTRNVRGNLFLDSIPLIYMCVHMPVSHCLDYCSVVVSFKIGMSESSNFILFQDCFGSSESLAFPSVSTNKSNWGFDRVFYSFASIFKCLV